MKHADYIKLLAKQSQKQKAYSEAAVEADILDSLNKESEFGPVKILLVFWFEEGVPKPEVEFRFHQERKWRFDFAWPAKKVYLEKQGGTWRKGGGAHQGTGAIRDMEKFSEASILGWRPLFCQPSELMTVATAEMIKRALKFVK